MLDIPDENIADLILELQAKAALIQGQRRRPMGSRKRGPPAPPTKAELGTAMQRIVKDFYRRRGWPATTSEGYLACVRRENSWASPRMSYQHPERLREAKALLPQLLKA